MTYKVAALSWDEDFKDFFERDENKEDLQIHSVFNKVVNINSSDRVLYTIANKHTDNAPYTLRVDFEESFKDIIHKEDKVLIEKNKVLIGGLEIGLSDLALQNNKRKCVTGISLFSLKTNIEIFNDLIGELGEYGGCKAFYVQRFLEIYQKDESLVEKELTKRIESFYDNLMDNKLDKEDIKRLIGLGIGLTPSGDDFLTGFLASISIFNFNIDLVDKIKAYIYPFLSSTTDISSAMLKAALEDKYREFLNEFIYSFFGYREEKFVGAFKNLLTVGSSSGTDMSIGVLIGFAYTLERIEKRKGISSPEI